MKKKITVLRGDGIGPEVVEQSLKVLSTISEFFNIDFEFQDGLIGGIAIDQKGEPLPEETVEMCKNSDAVLLGAIGDPKFDNDTKATHRPEQGLLSLRKKLGLFANVRPINIYPSLSHLSPLKEEHLVDVDFVIYRELTGGIYFGEKHKSDFEASDLCLYKSYEIERIAELAFKAAMKRRKRLCLVDKANVLESSRLWRRIVQKMSKDFPDVNVDFLYVDNAAMQLIVKPSQFDVILTSNMFGDILSDEASVLSGSIGLLPSASFGTTYKLYEPIHGSYPQAKNKNIANPIASILSAEMMIRDIGFSHEADTLKKAVESCIMNNFLTEDINRINPMSCSEVGDEISRQIVKHHSVLSN